MIFPKHDYSVDSRLVFVVMPFAPTFNTLYDSIESLVRDYCHLRCWRADSESIGNRIMSDVWRITNEAVVIIADLSGNNANVFYEVGLAHAIGKPVILLTSNTEDIPFDVRDIRALPYDSTAGFRVLREKLLSALRSSIVTLPERWRVEQRPDYGTPRVRITHVQYPLTIRAGEEFRIIVRARNEGHVSREGYFSVSFPDAVSDGDIEIVETDLAHRIGKAKGAWSNDTVILAYPIAEAFKSPWEPGQEHFLTVRARTHRTGWLPFFINSSSRDSTKQKDAFETDPSPGMPHIDQRNEPVYCGILDVSA